MTTAAIAPGYAGHPEADLLSMLAAELAPLNLAVTVAFGSQADAENVTGAARVIFVEDEITDAPIRLQPGDGKALFEEQRGYNVAIHAPEVGTLIRLRRAVVVKLDEILSWTAVTFGKPAKIGQRSSGAGSGGFGLLQPVTIKGPAYSEVYGTAVAQTVSTSTTVADLAGGDTIEDLS